MRSKRFIFFGLINSLVFILSSCALRIYAPTANSNLGSKTITNAPVSSLYSSTLYSNDYYENNTGG